MTNYPLEIEAFLLIVTLPFIIGIELLTNQIRTNENIKGITLTDSELKITCYANDASFILDGTQKSFESLIDVLENFSNISGLKLSPQKLPGITNWVFEKY